MSTIKFASLPPVSKAFFLDFSSRVQAIGGPIGTGKAQPLESLIMTPTGPCKMGDIKVGDRVIGSDGKPTVVIGVYPQGVKPIYRVIMSDGSETNCCDEHLWLTHSMSERAQASKPFPKNTYPSAQAKVRSLAEIRSSLRWGKHQVKNHKIPMTMPVEFERRELLIHPYIMGVILGDGGISSSRLTISSADEEIIESIQSLLPNKIWIRKIPSSTYDYCIHSLQGRCKNPYLEALKLYGLMGKRSHEKWIPDDYLYSSIEDRVSLLQGLMDTDGTVDYRGGQHASFSTTSLKLAEGVISLCQSLGGTGRCSEKKTIGLLCYNITVSLPPDIIPFRLARKRLTYQPKTKYTPSRFIVDVVPAGNAETQCIAVAAKDSLYLTDQYIVTHNTFLQALRVLFKATHIVPCPDGVRRSSFIIVRKRYGDLEQSVVPAFEKIAGAAFDLSGRKSPLYGKIYFKDKLGKVECDLWLYAFETVADAQKIRSLAFTDGAIIEAQELDSGIIIKEVFKRLGRYPAPANADELDDFENNPMIAYQLPNGQVARGRQLTLDFNYTNSTHWLKKYLVDDNKANAAGVRRRTLYEQPPTHIWMPGSRLDGSIQGVVGRYHGEEGVFMRNPEALHYIKHNGWSYWEDILLESMGDDALIQQDILASWGDYINGKPVYPKFSRTRHVALQELKYIPGRPVYVGVDNGFNNAWIFAQQDHSGRVLIIDEIVNVGADAKSIKAAIKDDVKPYINLHIPLHTLIFVADQAFWNGEGGEGKKQIEQLTNEGFTVEKSPFKFTTPMRDAVDTAIATEQLLVSPRCNRFIDAMVGGFHYPLVRSTGSFSEEPNQNSEHSHPANAGEFVISRLIKATPKRKASGPRKKKEYSYV